ncbi:unnamed protein product [Rhizophagus irregularis]|uniref:Uncharacterized protein n=2 Tax=Rhizophagus irregularis TaxID=588596 RepID=A0A915Z5P1_9GLOM|nr:hypothetical protein RirG_066830 [Rhizophagus irregularis DAOM 197198w]UZO24497.1 hypothetical protein OCT59_016794 [Rhizophagus irregularis]GBC46053.2 hypothetical protein GLOIN_2v1607904 [Rhizophagus irregularis DAOM 181602=DAOM 197198]CAB4397791.1 unnamed protein product [Rhizophagus irregularis]CAB4404142.1 unnamed protein product [Rhizophagus irregularis]
MVIKRKLRNSTANTSTPVPEVKSEEIKTPSPTPPVKVERRGRPRKSETSEEITNDRPVKASRPNETFKIIPFNPKGTTSNSKGKEKETTQSPTDLPSEPVYNEPVQQFEPNFVTLPEAPVFSPLPQQQSHITPPIQGASTYSGNILQTPRNTRPRKWIRRKVVIKTTGAEIAVPVWYSNEQKQLNNYGMN